MDITCLRSAMSVLNSQFKLTVMNVPSPWQNALAITAYNQLTRSAACMELCLGLTGILESP
jgi:hypothetical protein